VADVFVSYAREDLPFVRRLTGALRARNREVWVDLEDIIPSARWMEEIRTAITEADAVAFVITPDSVTSKVCRASALVDREKVDVGPVCPRCQLPGHSHKPMIHQTGSFDEPRLAGPVAVLDRGPG
jgi:hypothetical protein